jgi:ketosteroid isomerase-like protein
MARKEIPSAMAEYFKDFAALKVMVNDVFVSCDGTEVAIQWDWAVTRKSDGKRGLTHDAILVKLEGGKIRAWSEYFDFGNSVDAKP